MIFTSHHLMIIGGVVNLSHNNKFIVQLLNIKVTSSNCLGSICKRGNFPKKEALIDVKPR